MTSTKSDRSVVVVQLSGGNDALNTVVPYGNGLYYDWRRDVRIEQDQVLKLDDQLGFNPSMAPIKELWDEGKVAVINGVGYPSPNRSHFRSMDIWHTAESEGIGESGWLGRTIRELDPKAENVLTGVNFGRGLPRALSCKGVPVASVGDLEAYGLLPDIKDQSARELALKAFSQIYGGAMAHDAVSQFIGQTGADALRGADILRTAPEKYHSSVEYADTPIAQSMKGIAQVMTADLGTPSSTRSTAASTRTRPSWRRTRSCGPTRRPPWATSWTTSKSTTWRTTSSSSSSPSLAGASRTTRRAPTTAPAESPSSSAGPSTAGSTGSTRH